MYLKVLSVIQRVTSFLIMDRVKLTCQDTSTMPRLMSAKSSFMVAAKEMIIVSRPLMTAKKSAKVKLWIAFVNTFFYLCHLHYY